MINDFISKQDFTEEFNIPEIEVIEYIKASKKGDIKSRNTLIKKYMLLIIKFAKIYGNSEQEINDLVGEGVIGIINAINKFNNEKDSSFMTYAYFWVRREMIRYIINKRSLIRIPVHMAERIYKYKKIVEKYKNQYDSIPNREYIAKNMKLKLKEVEHIEKSLYTVCSINKVVGDDLDTELINFIVIDNNNDIYDTDVLLSFITDLKKRSIFKSRFGLIDKSPKTLEEVGLEYNITGERVRQIENECIKQIRRRLIEKGYAEELHNLIVS